MILLRRALPVLVLCLACAAWKDASSATVDDLVAALHAGDDARARELLDTLEAQGLGGSHDVRFLKGVLHLRAGKGEQAARVFAELEALGGPAPKLASGQALSAWAAGRPAEARTRLEEATRLWPEDPDVWANLGDVYRALAARAYHRVRMLRGDVDAGAGAGEPRPELLLYPQPLAPAPSSAAPSLATPAGNGAAPGASEAPATSAASAASEAPAASAAPEASVTPSAPAAATASAAPETPAASAAPTAASGECFRAGPWPEETLPSRVREWLREHGARVLSLTPPLPSHHRVYLGPFGDRAEAVRTVADLKRRGLRDTARVASGPLRNAVSLGVYRKRENADRRVRALRAMGIAPEVQAGGTGIRLHGSAPDLQALTAGWSGAFPDVPLAPEPCPPPS